MQEHLLGVTINDQKAHLEKVLEEIRVNNEQLTKTLELLERARGEHQSVKQVLAQTRAALIAAQEDLGQVHAESKHVLSNAQRHLDQAETTSKVADAILVDANKKASKILIEADEKVVLSREHLSELQGFLVTAEEQASRITAEIGSLEYIRTGVAENLRQLRKDAENEGIAFEAQKNFHRTTLDSLNAQVAQARGKLEAARTETETLFRNLDERERKARVMEHDNEILRQRLVFLTEEHYK